MYRFAFLLAFSCCCLGMLLTPKTIYAQKVHVPQKYVDQIPYQPGDVLVFKDYVNDKVDTIYITGFSESIRDADICIFRCILQGSFTGCRLLKDSVADVGILGIGFSAKKGRKNIKYGFTVRITGIFEFPTSMGYPFDVYDTLVPTTLTTPYYSLKDVVFFLDTPYIYGHRPIVKYSWSKSQGLIQIESDNKVAYELINKYYDKATCEAIRLRLKVQWERYDRIHNR